MELCEFCNQTKSKDRIKSGARFCSQHCAVTYQHEKNRKNLIGQVFGKYKVLECSWIYFGNGKRRASWICLCLNCNTTFNVFEGSLLNGVTQCKKCHLRETTLRPFEALYNRFVYTTKVRNIENNVLYEDFIKFSEIKNCFYCNSIITWPEVNIKKVGSGYHLDRIDNSKGYDPKNVVVCCARCNLGRGPNFTHSEWVCMASALRTRECYD